MKRLQIATAFAVLIAVFAMWFTSQAEAQNNIVGRFARLVVGTGSNFPDGRILRVEHTYSGADFSARQDFARFYQTIIPTADLTKISNGIYSGVKMTGSHALGNSLNAISGETFWSSSGALAFGSAVSAWSEVDTAGGTANLAPFYGGGEVDDGGTATTFKTIYADRAYQGNGAGTIGKDYGLWLEDRRGFQSDGGTVSTEQHLIHANIDGTSGTYYVNADGQSSFTAGWWKPNGVSKPSCDSGHRGLVWYVPGGAGVLDTFELCRKDAANNYAWVTLF